MKKIFLDHRFIEAPFGVFSRDELEALFSARGKRGKPLGRNAIRLWLFLVNRTSGRDTQGFEIHPSCLEEIIPKESSLYEAFADLQHAGFIMNFHSSKNLWCLKVPNLKPVGQDIRHSEKTEQLEDSEKTNSEKTEGKLGNSPVFSDSTHIDTIKLQEIPPNPQTGEQGKFVKGEEKEQEELRSTILELLTSQNWRLIGNKNGSSRERMETVLSGPVEKLIKLSVHGSDTCLLRQLGYSGPLRKRSLIGPFRDVLEDVSNLPIEDDYQGEEKEEFKPLVFPDWYQESYRVLTIKGNAWKKAPLPSASLHEIQIMEWHQILKTQMGSQYNIWISPLEFNIVEYQEDKLCVILTCPTRYFLEWVRQNHLEKIRAVIPDDLEILFDL